MSQLPNSTSYNPDAYQDFLNLTLAVICRFCNKRVFDPDKTKGQKYLKDRCPECGKSPDDNKNHKGWGRR